jgi:hypothetical protein
MPGFRDSYPMTAASKALRRTYPHLENSTASMPAGDTSCVGWPIASETNRRDILC